MLKILLVSLFAVGGLVSSERPRKLLLSVYYESKCPDSRRFINEQLLPTVRQLQNYITLQMVPFGKASSINNGYGGFQCQHGPPECQGNLVQNCALDQMRDRSDYDKVVYVACEMNSLFGTKDIMQCARDSKLLLTRLQRCIISVQGMELQLISELVTNRIKPRFIPTVTINGEFNQGIQDRSQDDLMGTLCEKLKGVPQCDRRHNNEALSHVYL